MHASRISAMTPAVKSVSCQHHHLLCPATGWPLRRLAQIEERTCIVCARSQRFHDQCLDGQQVLLSGSNEGHVGFPFRAVLLSCSPEP